MATTVTALLEEQLLMVTNNVYHLEKKNTFLFQNIFFPFEQKTKQKYIEGAGMQQG